MSRICIIPARGGSKRIPKKNVRLFFDKPIIAYSISAALDTGLFDEVMVSTDDPQIAQIARDHGANVPFMRSTKSSSDYATTADVILEVLEAYEETGRQFAHGCCLYPTAPFISVDLLTSGFDKLIDKKYTTLFPVAPFSYPIWRSLKINEEDKLEMNWPEHLLTRSQDLPEAYHDCGQFYWFDIDSFKKDPKLIGLKSGYLLLEQEEFHDIDNESDWRMAELKYDRLKRRDNGQEI